MLKLAIITLTSIIFLFCRISFANPLEVKNYHYSDILIKTQQQLRLKMGLANSNLYISNIEISLPVYNDSLIVLNKPYGMNNDDTLTLPYALFITESSIEDVREFYQKELYFFDQITVDNNTVFLENYKQGSNYPQDYYRIPHIRIRSQKLSNGKLGTLLAITYSKD